MSYSIDDQGLIQAAAETMTTFREAVQMWERESGAAAIAAVNALAFERASGRQPDELAANQAGFAKQSAKCAHHDALAKILAAVIKLRWPAGAADLFS